MIRDFRIDLLGGDCHLGQDVLFHLDLRLAAKGADEVIQCPGPALGAEPARDSLLGLLEADFGACLPTVGVKDGVCPAVPPAIEVLTLHTVELEHDAYGNLKSAKRTTGEDHQVWEYAYPEDPELNLQADAWLRRNEILKATFKIGGVAQWQADYERNESLPKPYPHLHGYEIVRSVTGTSHPDRPLTLSYDAPLERKVGRPDDVEVRIQLNEYGNINASILPTEKVSNTTWGSDERKGQVTPMLIGSATGRAFLREPDAQLRVDGVRLQELGGGCSSPWADPGGRSLLGHRPACTDGSCRDGQLRRRRGGRFLCAGADRRGRRHVGDGGRYGG